MLESSLALRDAVSIARLPNERRDKNTLNIRKKLVFQNEIGPYHVPLSEGALFGKLFCFLLVFEVLSTKSFAYRSLMCRRIDHSQSSETH